MPIKFMLIRFMPFQLIPILHCIFVESLLNIMISTHRCAFLIDISTMGNLSVQYPHPPSVKRAQSFGNIVH